MSNGCAWLLAVASALLASCVVPEPVPLRGPVGGVPGSHLPDLVFKNCKPATAINPVLTDGRLPRMPGSVRRGDDPGYTVVRFDITTTGATDNVKILESTSKVFERIVLANVTKWAFRPAEQEGSAVRVTCTQKHSYEAFQR